MTRLPRNNVPRILLPLPPLFHPSRSSSCHWPAREITRSSRAIYLSLQLYSLQSPFTDSNSVWICVCVCVRVYLGFSVFLLIFSAFSPSGNELQHTDDRLHRAINLKFVPSVPSASCPTARNAHAHQIYAFNHSHYVLSHHSGA